MRSRSPRRLGSQPGAELPAELALAIDLFVEENGIDRSGEDALRDLPETMLRAVLDEGTVSGFNTSAVLMGRIKRARAVYNGADQSGPPLTRPASAASVVPPPNRAAWAARLGPPPMINGQPAGSYAARASVPHMQAPVIPAPPPGVPPGLESLVVAFSEENRLDEAARSNLRSQPADVQQAVIAEGTLTGRNPSAVLASRIRRVAEGRAPLPSHSMVAHGYAAGQPAPPLAAPPPQYAAVRPARAASPVTRFVLENGLDTQAEQKLRQQTPSVQQRVLAEGPLTGRNPSAVFSGRLRRILDGAPGLPPEEPMPARVSPSMIDAFAAENALDENAVKALQEAPEDVRRKVIEEGICTGRNPSAVLLSRLRRTSRPQLAAEAIAAFCDENGLDDSARALLWSQPPEVQQVAIDEGPLTGRNPSAVLASRIRRILDGSNPQLLQHAQATVPPPPPGQPPFELQVAAFATEYGLDEAARSSLFSQTPEVQQALMAEGPLTGRNPSAVLSGRLRRFQQAGVSATAVGQYATWQPPLGQPAPQPGEAVQQLLYPAAAATRPQPWSGGTSSPLSRFVQENSLDAQAEQKLREQPQSVQQLAIAEGPLTGRNPSAVLLSRIRRILETTPREEPPEQDPVDFVGAFAAENSLDEAAVQALREAPPELQYKVVEEGPLTGRNPNAVLLSRLRRVQA